MRNFWIAAGVIAGVVALLAGLTITTLEVLARIWNPVDDIHVEDFVGHWRGVYPGENSVEISIGKEGYRADVDRWPADLDCNVGRMNGPSALDEIRWTPSSSFEADASQSDGASALDLRSYDDESCPRSLHFSVERNARSGDLRIVYQVGALDDDTLDQALIFSR